MVWARSGITSTDWLMVWARSGIASTDGLTVRARSGRYYINWWVDGKGAVRYYINFGGSDGLMVWTRAAPDKFDAPQGAWKATTGDKQTEFDYHPPGNAAPPPLPPGPPPQVVNSGATGSKALKSVFASSGAQNVQNPLYVPQETSAAGNQTVGPFRLRRSPERDAIALSSRESEQ
eukprot:1188447-Prorocentrum_minimum.AAC.1